MAILSKVHNQEQPLNLNTPLYNSVSDSFITDCRSKGLSPATIRLYTNETERLRDYLDSLGVGYFHEITAELLRNYFIHVSQSHNSGGVDLAYRVIKTLTYWWEAETDGEFTSPIHKVKRKAVPFHPIKGITKDQVNLMVFKSHSLYKERDRAIVLFLFDTGLRVEEFMEMNVGDIDLISGNVEVNRGKGQKYRRVYMGSTTRRALRAYLKDRQVYADDPLFQNDEGERFNYWGIRQVLRRRSIDAGIPEQSPHDFRRGFALECLRNGMDIYTLQRLMGHADLQTMLRYLHMSEFDVSSAYYKASPVDGKARR